MRASPKRPERTSEPAPPEAALRAAEPATRREESPGDVVARAHGTRVVLGTVLGAFGIRGWIRIKPLGQDATMLLSEAEWELALRGLVRAVRVEEAKEHGGAVLAHLAGTDDRDAAEALRGAEVSVAREQLPDAEPGEYYWTDLIGLAVRNIEGVVLGRVRGLIAAPAHDVLRVEGDEQREQLIPFVEPIVRNVALAEGTITVDWQKDY